MDSNLTKPELVELQRFRHGEPLEDYTGILESEQIPFKVSSTAPTFDITSLGQQAEADVIVSVASSDYQRARAAMEASYLETELPADHHLRTATDDDLLEILSHEPEWSAFDVAHARQIAESRNLNDDRVNQMNEQRLRLLSEGKQASRVLVLSGFILSLVGAWGLPGLSALGIGIAWSLISMKNKTPEGVFPAYDEPSRKTGKVMLWFSIFALIFGIVFVRLSLGFQIF